MPDEPRLESRPRPRRARAGGSDPIPIAALLVPTLARLGWGTRARHAQLMWVWPEVVGDVVAAETTLAGFERGRLTVETTSPALSHQLLMQRQVIIDGLNQRLEERLVRDIRFRLRPDVDPKAPGAPGRTRQ